MFGGVTAEPTCPEHEDADEEKEKEETMSASYLHINDALETLCGGRDIFTLIESSLGKAHLENGMYL